MIFFLKKKITNYFCFKRIFLQEDRNGSVVLASSRHMKEEYEMNMTIPRAKVVKQTKTKTPPCN